jgi:uncharacterized protein (TIGR02246 family)
MTEQKANDNQVEQLYNNLINSWNEKNATEFAGCFSENGNSIGFDGSQANGKSEIEKHLSAIFKDHPTASYVAIIRNVRFISVDVAILTATVGMIPPGKDDIKPVVNAIQTILARKENDTWLIEQLQNTPAAYPGRHELSEKQTEELRGARKNYNIA